MVTYYTGVWRDTPQLIMGTLEYHMKLGSQNSLITAQTDEKLGEEEKFVGQIGDTTPFTI